MAKKAILRPFKGVCRPMQKKHKKHLRYVVREAGRRIREKYIRGQKEHGGDLWTRDLLEEAINEGIDLLVYLLTLKERRYR